MDTTNCSAGAQMIIAQMKTNPDEFREGGRFYELAGVLLSNAAVGVAIALPNTIVGGGRAVRVTPRDLEALRDAYNEIIVEQDFAEEVARALVGESDVFLTAERRKAALQNTMKSMMGQVQNMGIAAHAQQLGMQQAAMQNSLAQAQIDYQTQIDREQYMTAADPLLGIAAPPKKRKFGGLF